MLHTVWLGLFAPLVGFIILLTFSFNIPRRLAEIIACTSILISFICFASPIEMQIYKLFTWIPSLGADFSVNIDSLSIVMTLIITGIGFLIHVYSIGYMEHEEDYARYFACLNLFVFAMLLLVLGENLLLLFVGWEGVGLASYLLIGYWYHRPAAANAATKAFVVNRIGDLGLLLGILLAMVTYGTSNITEINSLAVSGTLLTVLTLLFFCGSIGKSAQLPLHVWLPDAMEGPTPVSALIHAATMVTAGVYLIVRLHPLFIMAPITLQVIGSVGIFTSLFAALCAVGQTDLKRVLAYSTISQLGLMFLACSVGAFFAAMFHLTTHAFIKALLFLSAGNVVHAMHGSTEMEKMGGLRKKLPITHVLFVIGALAMSGIPPLSAFFSKDLILELEHVAGYDTFYYIGLIISVLTAFYLTRAYCLTFLGTPRITEKVLKMVHEVSYIMLIPVFILAIFAVIGGFFGFSCGKTPILEGFLADIGITLAEKELTTTCELTFNTIIAILAGVIGIVAAVMIYRKFRTPIEVLRKSFYVDEIYQYSVVYPLQMTAKTIDLLIEPKFFDGMIKLVSKLTNQSAQKLQQFQSGQIRSYIAWMIIGMVLIIFYLME